MSLYRPIIWAGHRKCPAIGITWRQFRSNFAFTEAIYLHFHVRFGIAGQARRWLVYPGALIWPDTLPSTVLFRALHEPEKKFAANGWSLSRYQFFSYFTVFAFVLFWFPDYIWTSLSTFAFVTWIAPHNQKVNTIFGVRLNILSSSFDCQTAWLTIFSK